MSDQPKTIQEQLASLLGSQRHWLFAEERERILMAGFRAGKTRILVLGGVVLSYINPGNLGFIGRASAKDLQTTTLKTFLEVCPPDLIVGKPKRIGQTGLIYTLRTKDPTKTSEIYFDYIIDKQSGKSHLAGGDWGWFGVDQVEEIRRSDWAKLTSRLSRTTFDPVLKKRVSMRPHALGVGNQIGHDWIWEDFFSEEVRGAKIVPGNYVFDIAREPRKFYKSVHRDLPKVDGKQFSRLGVITRAEENKMSNGGYVGDDYFDAERASNPPEWVARYLDGSFDDFSGKVYGDYNLSSVHNIEPFAIPSHWPWYCVIDPGGSTQWGVGVFRVDEDGNRIMVSDAPEIYKLNLNPNKAIRWIKDNVPVDETRFIIDYQNRAVMIQMQDEGIACEPANKEQFAGLMRLKGDFFVHADKKLPVWYARTQPKEQYERFKLKGSPLHFIFKTCTNAAKSLDNYIWDPAKKNEPKGNQEDHYCDLTKYFTMASPISAMAVTLDPFLDFRRDDPTSADLADRVSRELQRQRDSDYLRSVRESEPCDGGVVNENVEFVGAYGE